uniref:Uncharacterized protein n=1 Tax=Anguilla anguilla TaxID=7936 RepID=A0A0E9VRA5_ANGAN
MSAFFTGLATMKPGCVQSAASN